MSPNTEMKAGVKEWRPASYISYQHRQNSLPDESAHPYALVILNQPISNADIFSEAYQCAQYVVCADGGANRLYELYEFSTRMEIRDPDAICGDLDSIYDHVKEYYQDKGVHIIHDPNQYSTDFTKCLKYTNKYINEQIGDDNLLPGNQQPKSTSWAIAVIGGLGGRADQAFSQLHHLYAASADPSLVSGGIYLITPESVIFVLEKGLNRIYTPVSPDLLAENVGIIPLGGPSVITTRGLEWDVTDWKTEFGGQISTSNHIRSGVIEVETSERVIFTVELAVKP